MNKLLKRLSLACFTIGVTVASQQIAHASEFLQIPSDGSTITIGSSAPLSSSGLVIASQPFNDDNVSGGPSGTQGSGTR